MSKDKYQLGFSEMHEEAMYDEKMRKQKARKIIAVLNDHFSKDLDALKVLDIGSSTGIMTSFIGEHFQKITGIDIDEKAVEFAREKYSNKKIHFQFGDSMDLDFVDNNFDVVICANIYEHVPDSKKLMDEIYRVLKPGGICYLSAGNRIILIESHYKLPFLSIIPKTWANYYLRILGKSDFYYEKHLFLWELKKLVKNFIVHDYTLDIIKDPIKFSATEIIKPGSLKQKIYYLVAKSFYFVCPSYIWLLEKPMKRTKK